MDCVTNGTNVSATSVNKALHGVQRLFFDTALLIYFVEENVAYIERIL